jgi:peroxiredoxin
MIKAVRNITMVLILAAVTVAAGCSGGATTGQVPVEGGTAPDFTLKSLDGQKVSLRDFRGKSVLLNLWATWCGPCRGEMPFLQEVSEDPEWAKRGLVVLGVNLGESAAAVQQFMEVNSLSFTVLLDTEKEVGVRYNARYIPTTYFIDKDGIIRNIKIGAFASKSDIDRAVINMLTNSE